MTLEEFLHRLNKVKRTGTGHISLCPAHDDHRRSLSITLSQDRILIHCHAGCSPEEIVAAMGLEMKDLFLNPTDTGNRAKNARPVLAATYPYTDEHGELLYEVLRYDPKDFRVRRPKEDGKWHWNLKDTRA